MATVWKPSKLDNTYVDYFINIILNDGKKVSGYFNYLSKLNKQGISTIVLNNVEINKIYNNKYLKTHSITCDIISKVYIDNTDITKISFIKSLNYIKKLNKDVINIIYQFLIPDIEYL